MLFRSTFHHSHICTPHVPSRALALGVSHRCHLFAPSRPTADPIASPNRGSRAGGHDMVRYLNVRDEKSGNTHIVWDQRASARRSPARPAKAERTRAARTERTMGTVLARGLWTRSKMRRQETAAMLLVTGSRGRGPGVRRWATCSRTVPISRRVGLQAHRPSALRTYV